MAEKPLQQEKREVIDYTQLEQNIGKAVELLKESAVEGRKKIRKELLALRDKVQLRVSQGIAPNAVDGFNALVGNIQAEFESALRGLQAKGVAIPDELFAPLEKITQDSGMVAQPQSQLAQQLGKVETQVEEVGGEQDESQKAEPQPSAAEGQPVDEMTKGIIEGLREYPGIERDYSSLKKGTKKTEKPQKEKGPTKVEKEAWAEETLIWLEQDVRPQIETLPESERGRVRESVDELLKALKSLGTYDKAKKLAEQVEARLKAAQAIQRAQAQGMKLGTEIPPTRAEYVPTPESEPASGVEELPPEVTEDMVLEPEYEEVEMLDYADLAARVHEGEGRIGEKITSINAEINRSFLARRGLSERDIERELALVEVGSLARDRAVRNSVEELIGKMGRGGQIQEGQLSEILNLMGLGEEFASDIIRVVDSFESKILMQAQKIVGSQELFKRRLAKTVAIGGVGATAAVLGGAWGAGGFLAARLKWQMGTEKKRSRDLEKALKAARTALLDADSALYKNLRQAMFAQLAKLKERQIRDEDNRYNKTKEEYLEGDRGAAEASVGRLAQEYYFSALESLAQQYPELEEAELERLATVLTNEYKMQIHTDLIVEEHGQDSGIGGFSRHLQKLKVPRRPEDSFVDTTKVKGLGKRWKARFSNFGGRLQNLVAGLQESATDKAGTQKKYNIAAVYGASFALRAAGLGALVRGLTGARVGAEIAKGVGREQVEINPELVTYEKLRSNPELLTHVQRRLADETFRFDHPQNWSDLRERYDEAVTQIRIEAFNNSIDAIAQETGRLRESLSQEKKSALKKKTLLVSAGAAAGLMLPDLVKGGYDYFFGEEDVPEATRPLPKAARDLFGTGSRLDLAPLEPGGDIVQGMEEVVPSGAPIESFNYKEFIQNDYGLLNSPDVVTGELTQSELLQKSPAEAMKQLQAQLDSLRASVDDFNEYIAEHGKDGAETDQRFFEIMSKKEMIEASWGNIIDERALDDMLEAEPEIGEAAAESVPTSETASPYSEAETARIFAAYNEQVALLDEYKNQLESMRAQYGSDPKFAAFEEKATQRITDQLNSLNASADAFNNGTLSPDSVTGVQGDPAQAARNEMERLWAETASSQEVVQPEPVIEPQSAEPVVEQAAQSTPFDEPELFDEVRIAGEWHYPVMLDSSMHLEKGDVVLDHGGRTPYRPVFRFNEEAGLWEGVNTDQSFTPREFDQQPGVVYEIPDSEVERYNREVEVKIGQEAREATALRERLTSFESELPPHLTSVDIPDEIRTELAERGFEFNNGILVREGASISFEADEHIRFTREGSLIKIAGLDDSGNETGALYITPDNEPMEVYEQNGVTVRETPTYKVMELDGMMVRMDMQGDEIARVVFEGRQLAVTPAEYLTNGYEGVEGHLTMMNPQARRSWVDSAVRQLVTQLRVAEILQEKGGFDEEVQGLRELMQKQISHIEETSGVAVDRSKLFQ